MFSGQGGQGMGSISSLMPSKQKGGQVDYSPYIEAYEGLDDDTRGQVDEQVYGYMQENGIPEDDENTRLAVMKQVFDSMSGDGEEEMSKGGRNKKAYKHGQLITYQEGGKTYTGRVKSYNPYSGDMELY